MSWWILQTSGAKSWLLERRMFLRHWLVVFKLDTLPFQSESSLAGMYSRTKKKDRSLKHATLFRYKRLWKRDRKQFKEDFVPPLQEKRCIKTTVLNTQLLLWWNMGLFFKVSAVYIGDIFWYLTFTFTSAKFKNKWLQSFGYLIQTEMDYSDKFLLGTVLISSKTNGRNIYIYIYMIYYHMIYHDVPWLYHNADVVGQVIPARRRRAGAPAHPCGGSRP